ncbi:MAG: transcription elongation factor subunit Spt4 [Candidatus Anstonellales archaeon]
MKACRNCNYIIEEGKKCPVCQGEDLTDNFSGFIYILDVEKSEVAKMLEIKTPGKYAVNVK